MVLSSLTSTVVALVESSWIVASITVKYFLMGLLIRNLFENSFTWEKVSEEILESSELVVTTIIGLGAILALFDFSPSPMAKLFSEITALAYFAYLFWKY